MVTIRLVTVHSLELSGQTLLIQLLNSVSGEPWQWENWSGCGQLGGVEPATIQRRFRREDKWNDIRDFYDSLPVNSFVIEWDTQPIVEFQMVSLTPVSSNPTTATRTAFPTIVITDSDSDGIPDDCDSDTNDGIPDDPGEPNDSGNGHWYRNSQTSGYLLWDAARQEAIQSGGDLLSLNTRLNGTLFKASSRQNLVCLRIQTTSSTLVCTVRLPPKTGHGLTVQ